MNISKSMKITLFDDEAKMQRSLAIQEEDAKRKERAHNLRQLLRAHLLMEKDVDYIVQEDKIVIIDENTGRPQPAAAFPMACTKRSKPKKALRSKAKPRPMRRSPCRTSSACTKNLQG